MVILGDTEKKNCFVMEISGGHFAFSLFPLHSLVDEEICFFNYRVW